MTQRLHIKPSRPGLIIRGPHGEILPDSGARKPDIPFWRRKLDSGDVEEVEAETVASDDATAVEAIATETRSDTAPMPAQKVE